MGSNEFKLFCPDDTGSNLLSTAQYEVTTDRTTGQKAGTASSRLNNKALRQANMITNAIAQVMADVTDEDVLDEGESSGDIQDIFKNLLLTVFPTGCVVPFSGSSAPQGFLFCDGSAVSRITYARLFDLIGETYGPGDTTTTFNVPDLRGRVVAGRDNMGGSAAGRLSSTMTPNGTTLGATGGEQTHQLITGEMPSHTHTQDAHTHTQNAHTHTQNAHGHRIYGSNVGSDQGTIGPGNVSSQGLLAGENITSTFSYWTQSQSVFGGSGVSDYIEATAATNQNATATNQNTTATNQSTGGDGAHLNVQPTMILNMIIRI